MKKGSFFAALILVIFTGSIVLAGGSVGSKAPTLQIKKWMTPDAPSINYNGRVTIVEFWATWCGACVKNIPHLNELNEKYQPQGVDFIALSSDKSENALASCIKKNGIKYNVALGGSSVDDFGVTAYPTMFVVDSDGVVVWKGFPWTPGLEGALEKAIAKRGPDNVIDGIDLGPFKNMQNTLKNGNSFANAYKTLEMEKNGQIAEKKGFAARILALINKKISSKINFAKSIEKKEPLKAKKIYTEVVKNYDGIDIAEQAKEELKKLDK